MSISLADLRNDGVFGFPQAEALILHDQDNLRFSIWNNHDFLFAQAIMWQVSDDVISKTEDNRDIGNWSMLHIDADADGRRTPEKDRNFSLNPWPHRPGLHYQTVLSENSSTGLEDDSKGRGSICYVETSDSPSVRVDSYLIPLIELSQCVGGKIRLCYWGFSPHPLQRVNSVDFQSSDKTYYSHLIPLSVYHYYELSLGHDIDPTQIPEGRSSKPTIPQEQVSKPKVGEMAPEISAEEWLNIDVLPTLTALRGQVVLLDFWATWCGPCVAGIPHLNRLYEKYQSNEFQLLSLAIETRPFMEKFMQKSPINYPVGTNSSSFGSYGIIGIPYAFLIDKAGKMLWHGYPDFAEIDNRISVALASEG